ncbi:MAG: hypothetical protein FIA96_01680, partial [Betaproteobacteria bacterium]|nr:hypothetical protein [Betaproteobacteria bacterium]
MSKVFRPVVQGHPTERALSVHYFRSIALAAVLAFAHAGTAGAGTLLDGIGSGTDWTTIAGPHSRLELSSEAGKPHSPLTLGYRQ